MSSLFWFELCLTVAICSAILSFILSVASSRWAHRYGAVDKPLGGRKIHRVATPQLGGVGIAMAIALSFAVLSIDGILFETGLSWLQILGYVAGMMILLIGGSLDDMRPLPAKIQIIFPILAALCVLFSGTKIIQITQPGGGALSLEWWTYSSWHVSLPGDMLTFGWLLLATYATKMLDGLDGLVSGIAVIGTSMVGALTLSAHYFQPGVALLSAVIGGSFAGFLPKNLYPARQFLGEAGSTLAGFSLGFLAIVSSAKIAIALAVLAIPLFDACGVVVGRLRRGVSPFSGDDTHLHFRLLQAGVPHKTAVRLLWGVSLAAGVMALSLQTRGKVFLVAALAVLTALASWGLARLAKYREPSV